MNVQQGWFSQWLGAGLVLAIGAAALVQQLPGRQPGPLSAGAETIPGTNGIPQPCTLDPPGFLRGRFFGALDARIDWAGAGLGCSGMPRPDGRGTRLYFAHELPGQGRLSVQISIEGPPAGLAGGEKPASVTIIDPSGRFFSSGGFGRCWARISSVRRQPGTTDLRIEGLVYCVGALPSIQDRTSLTLGDLHFAGRTTIDVA